VLTGWYESADLTPADLRTDLGELISVSADFLKELLLYLLFNTLVKQIV
jgi:hypothetical protein